MESPIADARKYKTFFVLAVVLIVGILFVLSGEFSYGPAWTYEFQKSLGHAMIIASIIGVVYEWFTRKEFKRELIDALLTDEDIVNNVISADKMNGIINTYLNAKIKPKGKNEIKQKIFEKLIAPLFGIDVGKIFNNYHYSLELEKNDDKYVGVKLQVEYTYHIESEELIYAVVRNEEELNKRVGGDKYLYITLIKNKDIKLESAKIENVKVDGFPMEQEQSKDIKKEEFCEYVFRPIKGREIKGTEGKISFTVKWLVPLDNKYLFLWLPMSKGAVIEFINNLGVNVDIKLDIKSTGQINFKKDGNVVKVEIDGYTLPKSKVYFLWN